MWKQLLWVWVYLNAFRWCRRASGCWSSMEQNFSWLTTEIWWCCLFFFKGKKTQVTQKNNENWCKSDAVLDASVFIQLHASCCWAALGSDILVCCGSVVLLKWVTHFQCKRTIPVYNHTCSYLFYSFQNKRGWQARHARPVLIYLNPTFLFSHQTTQDPCPLFPGTHLGVFWIHLLALQRIAQCSLCYTHSQSCLYTVTHNLLSVTLVYIWGNTIRINNVVHISVTESRI